MIKQKRSKVKQAVLPFVLETTYEIITPRAGLVLFGEFLYGLRLNQMADKYLPLPKSGRGYKPKDFILPLVLMLNGGGRAIEDIREIKIDEGLRELLCIEKIPSSDAFYAWLRRMGKGEGLKCLEQLNRFYLHKHLKKEKIKDYTLDIDATAILAEKKEAEMTYKGFRGYMPIVGHLAENGLVVYDEFRQGNTTPSARNLEFIKNCERQMPRGKRIGYLRADAASYQAEIFNYCEERGTKYAIGAHIDRAVKEAILSIKEDEWRPYENGSYIAETVHCMEKTNQAFRLIVVRRPYQPRLFGEEEIDLKERYKVIATNLDWPKDVVVKWYDARGEYSENRIKELKIGFSMERMPSSYFKANAVFFRIGVLAYNLFRIFQLNILPKEYKKHQIKTIRWKLYNIAGRIVYHSRKVFLKVKNYAYSIFKEMRYKIFIFCGNSA